MKRMLASEVWRNLRVGRALAVMVPALAALSPACTVTRDLGSYPRDAARMEEGDALDGAGAVDAADGAAAEDRHADAFVERADASATESRDGGGEDADARHADPPDAFAPDANVAPDAGNRTDGAITPAQAWMPGPPLLRVHHEHTATRLASGKVLVVGGSTAELYDPAIDDWVDAGTVSNGRYLHTATLLANGNVLIVGGSAGDNPPLDVQLYDPDANTWSTAGTLPVSLVYHTATVLDDGRVLIAGQPLVTIYDPVSNTFAPAPLMLQPRYAHSAALIGGRVVVAGGVTSPDESISSVEAYDPAKNRWIPLTSMNNAHVENTATLLPDGRLLLAGGSGGVEIYDPNFDRWVAGAPLLHLRANHTATLLPDGTVLVAGGDDVTLNVATAEIYDPIRSVWTPAGMLKQARYYHSATLLNDGRVLVAGGFNYANLTALSTTEIYQPE